MACVEHVPQMCPRTSFTGVTIDIREVFHIKYDDEMERCAPLREALWQVVDAWDDPMKRKFLKFVTGVETLPSQGMEHIKIEVPFMSFSAADHSKALRMLPQSHVRISAICGCRCCRRCFRHRCTSCFVLSTTIHSIRGCCCCCCCCCAPLVTRAPVMLAGLRCRHVRIPWSCPTTSTRWCMQRRKWVVAHLPWMNSSSTSGRSCSWR
jgi:hypothetical protein